MGYAKWEKGWDNLPTSPAFFDYTTRKKRNIPGRGSVRSVQNRLALAALDGRDGRAFLPRVFSETEDLGGAEGEQWFLGGKNGLGRNSFQCSQNGGIGKGERRGKKIWNHTKTVKKDAGGSGDVPALLCAGEDREDWTTFFLRRSGVKNVKGKNKNGKSRSERSGESLR